MILDPVVSAGPGRTRAALVKSGGNWLGRPLLYFAPVLLDVQRFNSIPPRCTPLARAFCQYRLYPQIRTCDSQVHSVGVILTGPGECVLCCYVELLQSSRVACHYEVVGRRGRAWLKRHEVVTQGFNVQSLET